MTLTVATDPPDDATSARIRDLADRVEREDGAPPLSDQARSLLGSRDASHALVWSGDQLVGYAQVTADVLELLARRDAVEATLDAAPDAASVWTHGRRSRLAEVVAARGFVRVRELFQLRRPLDDDHPLPAEPPLPDGVRIRSFVPGVDDSAWLAVNAAAFAGHAEQGRWTHRDLAARMAEPWFDPDGFLLAVRGSEDPAQRGSEDPAQRGSQDSEQRGSEDPAQRDREDSAPRDGELLGFHWTKVHPDGVGEVYVLGVAPGAQGLGLGDALLLRGLRLLAARGCPQVLLYVDGDNPGAKRLYERTGFTEYDLDVQWQYSAGRSAGK